MEDLPHSTVAVGDFLAEEDLEKEAERSALMFRNKGYYGLTKSYYLFDADTLAHDGTAKLTYNLRDYALGDPVSTAKPHQKFTLGKVNITHPEKLKRSEHHVHAPGQPGHAFRCKREHPTHIGQNRRRRHYAAKFPFTGHQGRSGRLLQLHGPVWHLAPNQLLPQEHFPRGRAPERGCEGKLPVQAGVQRLFYGSRYHHLHPFPAVPGPAQPRIQRHQHPHNGRFPGLYLPGPA